MGLRIESFSFNYGFFFVYCVMMLDGVFNVRKDELWAQRSRGMTDPLEMVAEEIAEESVLLCIDEFMVCL